jgi:hypothetical protein
VEGVQRLEERTGFFARVRTHSYAIVVSGLLALAFIAAILMLYALWKFWPTSAALNSKTATPVSFLGIDGTVSTDVRMFVIVALAGALGGLLHATRSFVWYVGHGRLKWRWLPYYIITLMLGAGLGTIVYIVIRGGVFTGGNTSPDINPYGFAAIAALVGLFSEQALAMLRRVAEDFFHPAPTGKDAAPSPEADAAAAAAAAGAAGGDPTGATGTSPP